MNMLQIEGLLKNDSKTKKVLKKICAFDQLEKPVFPSAYVTNSDPGSEPREHWIAVYFDSYGLAPAFVGLKSYMDTYSLSGWISIAKPYKIYFRAFAVTITCLISYFISFSRCIFACYCI